MGKRAWLTDLIENEYLSAIEKLQDSPSGRAKAQQLAKTIRSGWASRGASSLGQQQSLMDQTRRAIKDRFGENHFSLDYIKFTTAEYTQLNDLKQGKVAQRNTQCVILDPDNVDALIATAVDLLQSPEWFDIAAALAVLTGRRSTEVIATACLTPKTKTSVIFTGALKRGGEQQTLSFEIPTLCPAEYVLVALERLRSIVDVQGKTRESINASYGQKIAASCSRHFESFIPNRPGKDNLYTHLFRAVYATIATWFYCPVNVESTEFKAHIQGHFAVLDENNPELRRQLVSSRHYSDFKIGDGKGNIDGRVGIKLNCPGVEVLEVFKQAATTVKPMVTQRKHRSSLRIWREDHDSLAAILSQFEGRTQPDKVSAWIAWTNQQLTKKSIATELTQPTELDENSNTEQATTITPTDHIHKEEHQQAFESAQTIQLTEPVTSLPYQDQAGTGSSGLEQSVSNGLESKLEKLIDVMGEFIRLQMQVHPNPQEPDQTASTTSTAESATRTLISKPPPTIAKTDQTESTKGRKYKTGEADSIVNAAINAIQKHNNQPDQLHDLKWEITINALKSFSTNQRVIQRMIEQRHAEIDAHHKHHQILPGHNNRHKRKRKIAQVIQF